MNTLKIILPAVFLQFAFVNSFAQWVQQNSTTTASLNDIYCVSSDTCYVAGNGTLLKTTDGGTVWFLQNSGINGAEPLQAVWCINENICFTGEANLYKTIDGGNSWVIKSTPLTSIASIFFVNDSVGYATAPGGGQIVRTTDAGETWNWSVIIGPTGGVSAVYFTDENIGYAVEYFFPDGRIWKTINGGSNWTQMYVETGILLSDMVFPNDSVGFAVGQTGTIIKTTDYGNNWTSQISGTTNPLTAIHCVDADTCYAAGAQSMIVKTTDGGNNWQPDTAGITTTVLWDGMHFPNADVGYVAGNGGEIFKRGTSTSVIEFTNEQAKVNIYPNPFSETATIYLNSVISKNTFELYDLAGRKIKEMQLNNTTTKLERNDLTTGMYIYRITNGGVLLAAGKVIIAE